jgi:hypothetical protein
MTTQSDKNDRLLNMDYHEVIFISKNYQKRVYFKC